MTGPHKNPICILLTVLTIGCQLLYEVSGSLSDVILTHKAELDQRGHFVMLWTPREDDIIIELQVETRGYVGLGFSPNGGMKGSDIVIGWIDNEGKPHLTDRYAKNQKTPTIDDSQDYTLLNGYKNSTHTVLRFSRPWVTCDLQHDVKLTDETVKVIWAYDNGVPKAGSSTLSYHDHRGVKNLYLKDPNTKKPIGGDVTYWDILSPNLPLPENLRTLYWCKLYKAPPFPKKTHFIGYEPLIQESSMAHVHHMILYECKLKESERHYEKWVQTKGSQCYSANMPLSWSACNTPIVTWAIGSDGEMLPEHVGFPLGDEHGGSTYFLLEIHYDNPDLKKGIVDDSGLRIYKTEKLRQYDAGVITLGHKVEPTHIIPPRESAWKTLGHCTSDCTRSTLPEVGIKVFSSVLHAHIIGRSISLKQIRNGTELEPIVSDDHYDFNYQQARVLAKERIILPGDHLITQCTYDSSNRSAPTFGGFATTDEMCLVFVSYYPRQKLSECISRPDINNMFHNFGITDILDKDEVMWNFGGGSFDEAYIKEHVEVFMSLEELTLNNVGHIHLATDLIEIKISEPPELANKTFYSVLMDPGTWSNEIKSNFEEVVTSQQYEPTCLYHGRKDIIGIHKEAEYPIYTPFSRTKDKCTPGVDKGSYSSILPAPGEINEVNHKSSSKGTAETKNSGFKLHVPYVTTVSIILVAIIIIAIIVIILKKTLRQKI